MYPCAVSPPADLRKWDHEVLHSSRRDTPHVGWPLPRGVLTVGWSQGRASGAAFPNPGLLRSLAIYWLQKLPAGSAPREVRWVEVRGKTTHESLRGTYPSSGALIRGPHPGPAFRPRGCRTPPPEVPLRSAGLQAVQSDPGNPGAVPRARVFATGRLCGLLLRSGECSAAVLGSRWASPLV